jgi:hypothetical protein
VNNFAGPTPEESVLLSKIMIAQETQATGRAFGMILKMSYKRFIAVTMEDKIFGFVMGTSNRSSLRHFFI